jgi:hypothetical protein
MKAPHEPTDSTHTELIADLEEEVISLQRKNRALQGDLFLLRRELRRARRNLGYKVSKGVSRAFAPVLRLFTNGANAHFPKPSSNGRPSHPCSAELKSRVQKLHETVDSAFFSFATERNWTLHKILGDRPGRQLCFSPEELKNALASDFFGVPQKAFEPGKGSPGFAHHQLIVIDCDHPEPLWPLLKGRFWPHQKLLLHGKSVVPEFSPTEHGRDFAFYSAPPPAWLDPRHTYLPGFAPWKASYARLTATLPSGNPWPKISVVTPSFNQGRFITDTFESILGQPYPHLEYLVLDGGSTDNTRSILDRYRPRLAYSCCQKDNGQADAINKGFARATGEIMAWLNSDDQYAADALMHVARAFDQFPEADIVVGGCGLVEVGGGAPIRIHHCALPMGKVVPLPLVQLLDLENCWLKGHFFYQPEVFWRRRIWETAGAHVLDDLYYCFDYELWVRMAKAGAKVVHIPELLALYRVHPEQKTYGKDLPYLPELKLAKARHGTFA